MFADVIMVLGTMAYFGLILLAIAILFIGCTYAVYLMESKSNGSSSRTKIRGH